MNLNLLSIFLLLSLASLAQAGWLTIYLRTGGSWDENIQLMWDEDERTIGDIAKVYCERRVCKDMNKVRVQNYLSHVFKPEKTLREAGIREGETFYVKTD